MPAKNWLELQQNRDIATLLGANRAWLVTGGAGFIGSNLVETLLRNGQHVTVLDNFATGYRRNLDEVEQAVGADAWSRFSLIEGDIRDGEACDRAADGVDIVLHQAALGSVPRSLADPFTSHEVNVTGFLRMLDAARRAGVGRFVYAASSSTYGDEPHLPKREDRIGRPLSPYAATKLMDEIYAEVYSRSYGFASVGLRYFNVFGPRQDPDGAYAAVIPKWVAAMIEGVAVDLNGDGTTSRDFSYVDNVVQANLRAALVYGGDTSAVYNVAVGQRVTLNELFDLLSMGLREHGIDYRLTPRKMDFRNGDVLHSLADVSKASAELGYAPTHTAAQGIAEALAWYIGLFKQRS